jgi:hypothetical protein
MCELPVAFGFSGLQPEELGHVAAATGPVTSKSLTRIARSVSVVGFACLRSDRIMSGTLCRHLSSSHHRTVSGSSPIRTQPPTFEFCRCSR